MARLRPFAGLLFSPSAGPPESLTAPPYDVISPMDRQRLYEASPFNAVRLILGKEEPGDSAEENRYARAHRWLDEWRRAGVLERSSRACVYPYELRFRWAGRPARVRGVIAEVELEPWGGSIVPHERTMPGPVEDRLALLRAVRANLSPVYVVLTSPAPEIGRFLDEATGGPPAIEVSDEAGTTHRLWAVPDAGPLPAAVARRPLMIADGHHRYTVALAYQTEARAQRGPGPWDSMMMFVVDAGTEDPPVLPIHRLVVSDDATVDLKSVADGAIRVRDMAEILAGVDDDDLTFGIVETAGRQLVHRVGRLGGRPPTVCALHERFLDRLNPRDLRFVPDAFGAERAVAEHLARSAFVLPPTKFERVWDVVESQRRLPQKSTYFWPKPRTGMVIRLLEC